MTIPADRPFPRYLVGLLQNESEMLQAPAYDLSAHLAVDPWFDVELYTDRTVHELMANQDEFACIVIGYNAAHESARVRQELAASGLRVGLCVLHQYSAAGHDFLGGALALSYEALGPDAVRITPAAKLEPDDEILLGWPESLPRDASSDAVLPGASAYYGVAPREDSGWRVVLEVSMHGRRVPVLLRTPTGRRPPVVMCSIMLSARDKPDHAALLRNLLLWCAAGRPTAVVVDSPQTTDAQFIHRKLHLQGVNAVTYKTEGALDFTHWPIRGTRDVIVGSSLDPTTEAGWPETDESGGREWLRAGGRLAVLDPGGGLTLHHCESDVSWMVRRWATWFHSVAPASWHGGRVRGEETRGSIVATRSVLRVLAVLSGDDLAPVPVPGAHAAAAALKAAGVSRDDLGLPSARAFAEPAVRLLLSRIGRSDNVDRTTTATTAALDIDALVGGGLDDGMRAALEGWLQSATGFATIDEQLDIARCLKSTTILASAIERLAAEDQRGLPISAVRVSALRSGLVACGLQPEDQLAGAARAVIPAGGASLETSLAVVDRELRTSGLLAATYLLSVCDLRTLWAGAPALLDDALTTPPEAIVDRAVITLGRLGPLIRGRADADDGGSGELVCAEALAAIAYFGFAPSPTHVLATAEAVPPQLLSSVLAENEGLRKENADIQRVSRRERRATNIVGIGGVLVVIGLMVLTVLLLQANSSGVEVVGAVIAVGLVFGVGMVALLAYGDVDPGWARKLAGWVPANRDELVDRMKRFVQRDSAAPREPE